MAAQNTDGELVYPSDYWVGKENQIDISNPNVPYFTSVVNDFSSCELVDEEGAIASADVEDLKVVTVTENGDEYFTASEGYEVMEEIKVQVRVPIEVKLKYVWNSNIRISNLTLVENDGTISVPAQSTIFVYEPNTSSSVFSLIYFINSDSSATPFNVVATQRYRIFEGSTLSYCNIFDKDSNIVMTLRDTNDTDLFYTKINLSKSVFKVDMS